MEAYGYRRPQPRLGLGVVVVVMACLVASSASARPWRGAKKGKAAIGKFAPVRRDSTLMTLARHAVPAARSLKLRRHVPGARRGEGQAEGAGRETLMIAGASYIVFDSEGYRAAAPFDGEVEISHYAPLAQGRDAAAREAVALGDDELRVAIKRALPPKRLGLVAALRYAQAQSWDKLDFSQFAGELRQARGLPPRESGLVGFGAYAMDDLDFGNFAWGAAMQALGVPRAIALLGAHYNAVLHHRELDTRADQLAIKMGYAWARTQALR